MRSLLATGSRHQTGEHYGWYRAYAYLGGHMVAQYENNTTYFATLDHLGSTRKRVTIETNFREPTEWEREVMKRFLTADFPGQHQIAKQISDCRVRTIDQEGSLALQLGETSPPAKIEKRIPVEAEALDEDGIHIHFLLHVVNGFANELEVYKDDGSPIVRKPDSSSLSVIVLPA